MKMVFQLATFAYILQFLMVIQTESQLHNLKQAATGISLYKNLDTTLPCQYYCMVELSGL